MRDLLLEPDGVVVDTGRVPMVAPVGVGADGIRGTFPTDPGTMILGSEHGDHGTAARSIVLPVVGDTMCQSTGQ